MGILTPWRTIRALRADLASAARIGSLREERADRELAEALTAKSHLTMQLAAANRANAALLRDVRSMRSLIKGGHFRQPNGRLGKKGQLPPSPLATPYGLGAQAAASGRDPYEAFAEQTRAADIAVTS